MAERAKVSSIEAIETFRANLIVYLDKAQKALDEISDEVRRTRTWIESDRRTHWEHEAKRRARKLEEAQQAVFSARLSSLRGSFSAEQLAAQKAKRACQEAEEKMRKLKFWFRHYDSRVEPVAKQVDKLRDVLDQHMREAVHSLTRTTKSLSEYAELRPPSSAQPRSSTEVDQLVDPGSPEKSEINKP
jgi:chromosome segregation ATPase